MDWIIGGTKDSRDFIDILKNDFWENKDFLKNIILTTASDYGKILASESGVEVKSLSMNEDEMKIFISKYNIKRIFDLSHPYAKEVSLNAMRASEEKNIDYFRFERQNLEYTESFSFLSIDEMIDFVEKLQGNILVTLGTNNIEKFKNIKNLENIYFRILPVKISIEKAEKAGIKAKNIIALQGPFSKEFNMAIYKNYNIKYILTKESGKEGGEQEKIEAAYEMNITPLILKRPSIKYTWVSSDMQKIVEKFKEGY